MGEERTLYESESRRSTAEVVDFLQQLAHWLGDRQIAFDDGDETVVITIPEEVELEIEIEEEEEGDGRVKRSLEVEIEWTDEKSGSVDSSAAAEAKSAVEGATGRVEEEE